MSYSATQLISISGFLQNRGLAVNSVLLSTLVNVEDSNSLSGKLHRVVNHANASSSIKTLIRTNIAGLSLAAPISYNALPARVSPTDVSGSLRTYANSFFKKGMAVRRAGGLFLKAPNVFKIVYRNTRFANGHTS